MKWLTQRWYRRSLLSWCLLPLAWLYQLISSLRRLAYQKDWLTRHKLPVPVIVVGNISVGGTGKTPFVIWLVEQLRQAGYQPGVVSRGYGGHSSHYPLDVDSQSSTRQVGDEPLLIHQRTGCPVVVDPNRPRAAVHLLAKHHCDVVISDDGLQHYALQRDIEIVLVDAGRRFGNKYCLPAGPLREPVSRLQQVDFIIYNGEHSTASYQMQLNFNETYHLLTGESVSLTDFKGAEIHAVAGIGHPQRFFDQLAEQQLIVHPHPFADHWQFSASDFNFADDFPILMTEKDAVKCREFANKNMWYVPVSAQLSANLFAEIDHKLKRINHG